MVTQHCWDNWRLCSRRFTHPLTQCGVGLRWWSPAGLRMVCARLWRWWWDLGTMCWLRSSSTPARSPSWTPTSPATTSSSLTSTAWFLTVSDPFSLSGLLAVKILTLPSFSTSTPLEQTQQVSFVYHSWDSNLEDFRNCAAPGQEEGDLPALLGLQSNIIGRRPLLLSSVWREEQQTSKLLLLGHRGSCCQVWFSVQGSQLWHQTWLCYGSQTSDWHNCSPHAG